MPYKRPMIKSNFLKKYEYVYEKFYDCYICHNNQILQYKTTNIKGYKECKSNPKVCAKCNLKSKCTDSMNSTKLVLRHI